MNEKLGKFKSSEIELEVDGIKIGDKKEIEGHFGQFFHEKVTKLSTEPVMPVNLVKPLTPLCFSLEELNAAVKLMSNKKSYGIDEVPQNLFKDTLDIVKLLILNLVNSFSSHGLPNELKVARVIPLHKKGSKLDITGPSLICLSFQKFTKNAYFLGSMLNSLMAKVITNMDLEKDTQQRLLY
jgi:hypothetical protein